MDCPAREKCTLLNPRFYAPLFRDDDPGAGWIFSIQAYRPPSPAIQLLNIEYRIFRLLFFFNGAQEGFAVLNAERRNSSSFDIGYSVFDIISCLT